MKAYPKYKESGVEWLGEVPEGWEIQRFRYVFRESDEKIVSEVFGEMLSVSGYRGIEIKEYDDENRKRLDDQLVGYRIVRPGQLVVNSMWLNYAGLGVSDYEGHVSPAYRAYDFRSDCDRRFIHHLMRSSRYVTGYTKFLTGIRPNSLQMSRTDLMDFPIVLPPLPEQRAIAAFLDHEVAKIDELIAEQERLIELLAEKRQATISHAVTKGLDPNAKLKPSGVEWLGDVPEDWEVVRLGKVAALQSGFAFKSELFTNVGIPVVKMNNLSRGVLDFSDPSFVPLNAADSRFGLQVGDIVWGMSGSIGDTGSLGNFAVVKKEDIPCFLNQRVGRFHIRNSALDSEFLLNLLQSRAFKEQIVIQVTGTAQFNISSTQVQSCWICLPPFDSQLAINEFISVQMSRFDSLTTAAREAIALLQERRSSLISAAVTGKIDVRGLVPDAAEAV